MLVILVSSSGLGLEFGLGLGLDGVFSRGIVGLLVWFDSGKFLALFVFLGEILVTQVRGKASLEADYVWVDVFI